MLAPKTDFTNNERNCEKIKAFQFSGVVEKKYYDYNRQGVFTIKIKTKDSIFTLTDYPIMLDGYVHNGDSIAKNRGGFEIKLFKYFNRDSILIINRESFDCDYWEKKFGDEGW